MMAMKTLLVLTVIGALALLPGIRANGDDTKAAAPAKPAPACCATKSACPADKQGGTCCAATDQNAAKKAAKSSKAAKKTAKKAAKATPQTN